MLQNKAAFLAKPSDLIFDLTNHRPSDLVGYWFHSLETGEKYLFTSLGDGLYCLVSPRGVLYSNPVSNEGKKRITALFVSKMFGTNNVIDYWKFAILSDIPEKNPTLIKLQGVQYEF